MLTPARRRADADDHAAATAHPVLSRRDFLRASTAAALAVPLAVTISGPAAAQPHPDDEVSIHPRDEWAQGLLPVGPLLQEQLSDVRFLLVHHTASSNEYQPEDVPSLIRGFYSFHTGADKNWPDVAYNFFVDRHGGAWEGRAGSLTGPVQPDATGGSQGFAQLCCFIGDHSVESPTEAARQTMGALLATLADRYGIETSPGTTTTFTSRGSNRWAAGTVVTTPTIAGHRDMSLTSCPGDAAYALVTGAFPAEVTRLRAARSSRAEPEQTEPPAPPAPPAVVPDPALPTAAGATSAPPSTGAAAAEGGGADTTAAVLAAGAVVTAGAAVGLYVRDRRHHSASRVAEEADTSPSGGDRTRN
ncbi:N-acetylmuramoyl-L-alanine amidase [Geodermatophilus nigrescens]